MRQLRWLAGFMVFGLVVASCSVATGESTTTEPLAVDCEGRSDPTGSAIGERPRPGPEGWGWPSMAFDVESGVIVATVWLSPRADRSESWVFDVCINAWRRGADVPFEVQRLVYHPGEDLTLALGRDGEETATWAYDVETDTWTELAPFPMSHLSYVVVATVDPESGLVWAGDVVAMSIPSPYRYPLGDLAAPPLATFDLASGVWSPVSLETDWGFGGVRLMTYDPAVSGFVLVTGSRVGRTSLLDPSGLVTEVDTPTPLPEFVWGDIVSGNEITFDAATGRVAIFSDGTLIEYDALAEEWVVLTSSDTYQDGMAVGPLARVGGSIVYDPVNRRIVLFGGSAAMPNGFLTAWDDVWAFDPISREWMVLLEAGMTRKYNATTGEWKAEPVAGGE